MPFLRSKSNVVYTLVNNSNSLAQQLCRKQLKIQLLQSKLIHLIMKYWIAPFLSWMGTMCWVTEENMKVLASHIISLKLILYQFRGPKLHFILFWCFHITNSKSLNIWPWIVNSLEGIWQSSEDHKTGTMKVSLKRYQPSFLAFATLVSSQ